VTLPPLRAGGTRGLAIQPVTGYGSLGSRR
jgi:hypothetical protein